MGFRSPLGAAPYGAFLICAAALAFGILFVQTSRTGIGLSPDSVGYVRIARDLAEPGGLVHLTDSRLSPAQPPLYPIALALLAKATGADPFDCARILSSLLLAAVIFATGIVFRRCSRSPHPLIAVWLPLLVLLEPSLHLVFSMAWTEPLFLLLVLLFLAAMTHYMAEAGDGALVTAALAATAAVYTRYSGVTLIATGALLIPLAADRSVRRRAADLVLFAGSTSAALGLWMARNLHLFGTPFGGRSPAIQSLVDNVDLSLRVVGAHVLSNPGAVTTLLVFAVAGAVALWAAAPCAGHFASRAQREWRELVPWAVFPCVFCAFTVVSSTIVAYDPIDLRLLSPCIVPVLVVAAWLLDCALTCPATESGGERRLRIVAAIFLAGALLHPAGQFVRDFAARYRDGTGLNHRIWAESELIAFLKTWERPVPGKVIFSNVRAALDWHVGIPARESPMRAGCASVPVERARECFFETVDPRFFDSYLAYFHAQKYPYFYTLRELTRFADLEAIEITSDGVLYAVSPRKSDR